MLLSTRQNRPKTLHGALPRFLRKNVMNVLSALLAPVLLTLSCSVQANDGPIVGEFGHNFTAKKNDPVWSIRRTATGLSILLHGDGTVVAAAIASDIQKQQFWDKMGWESNPHSSTCVAFPGAMLCHVPTTTRSKIFDLKDCRTGYFYFDSILGLLQVEKVGAK
jgi:hypothetical protein